MLQVHPVESDMHFVKGMVEAGIEVAMLDYSESLEQIRDELSALGKVYAFRCDLTDRKNRELIFDQAVEALGGLWIFWLIQQVFKKEVCL